MERQKGIKVRRLRPNARLPQRARAGATGFDLFACIEGEGAVVLGSRPTLISTGIAIEVPRGYDAQIRPMSDLSSKGVGVDLATVDRDYRGEVMVAMYLFSPEATFEVRHGDRIAQLVIGRLADLPIVEVEELTPTERGTRVDNSMGK
jgi:dUTP pyrophosphatase